MNLSSSKIKTLVKALSNTQEDEITCDDCLASVAEFVEYELSGKPMPEALIAVQQHLHKCEECQDEYKALYQLLNTPEE